MLNLVEYAAQLIYILTKDFLIVSTKDKEIKESFKGNKYTVTHCKGAMDSLEEALTHVTKGKANSLRDRLAVQIERLAEGHRMLKEHFPQEGNLPKQKNQSATKKFRALKRLPVRGYCWLSDRNKDTYYISHYVHKDYDKLKKQDVDTVGKNWKRIEVDGDEC